ncbi:MAG: ferredoxin, partial [Candidatus Aenigmarchaeota archaeon]|nr:ferredoxin [Candidatus Aenigmarchaeota archaeon]MDI6722499.1 ferredoxin [Candidatus Aenigmarchaeota archaeon]
MGTYVIEYEEKGCIGAGVCAAFSEKDWEIAANGKAVLKGGKFDEAKKVWVKEIGEKDLEINKQAAEGC